MLAASTNAIIGYPFIELNSVESTNNYAMQAVKGGLAKHGIAYFAYEQTAGKGQRNKQWLSAKNKNIILSVVVEMNGFSLFQQFYLNIISALAAFDLFNNYATNNVKIKWPNDIYWQDRKTGGILIENIVAGKKWKYAVIGFGLNINQTVFDNTLKNPASLKQITGENYSVIKLAKDLCENLQNKYHQLINGGLNKLMTEYNMHLYKKNTLVKFKKNNTTLNAYVLRVEDSGKLIVKTDTEQAFEFGSVEWITEQ